MSSQSTHPPLAKLIAEVQRSLADAPCVADLVLVCQRMAAAYVWLKCRNRTFDPSRLGLSVEDFAYDAIAEMFRRDESGSYQCVRQMTANFDLTACHQEELEYELRRRVFNAVNRQIYRSYRDLDPTLSKILRNVKRTLQDHQSAMMIDHFGEWVLVPRRSIDLHLQSPVLPPEIMSAELSIRIGEIGDLREMLTTSSAILAEQTEYARIFSILGLAQILRGVYARGLEETDSTELSDDLTSEELERYLHPALGTVLRRTGRNYVKKGKVTEEDLKTYARTLFDILLEEFNARQTENGSFYDFLVRHDPTVSRQDYLEKHRVILEYLTKLVRRELQESIKKEWKSLQ
jgi:hypothetical protein